jgi:hypothetical protein
MLRRQKQQLRALTTGIEDRTPPMAPPMSACVVKRPKPPPPGV